MLLIAAFKQLFIALEKVMLIIFSPANDNHST